MLLIRPGNPYDFEDGGLQTLADEIRAADTDIVIDIDPRSERGYGVTPWEVVEIVATIGGAAEAVRLTAKSVSVAVAWMRRRWQKDCGEHAGQPPRPRSVLLLLPDRTLLRKISIDLPDGEPTEEERLSGFGEALR
jgi:hypothetical protein